MSTGPTAERYPTVRQGYDPTLVESDLAAMERAHETVVDDAVAKIAALEHARFWQQSHTHAASRKLPRCRLSLSLRADQ